MNIEVLRLKAELSRVSSAKADLELKVAERLEEAERLKGLLATQEAVEKELQAKLNALKGG